MIKSIQNVGEQHAISVVESQDAANTSIVLLGGWDQNFSLMQELQIKLAETEGINSVGLSAFDSIDPIEEVSLDDLVDYGSYTDEQIEWMSSLPSRMIKRALHLTGLSRTVLRQTMDPSLVVTHCAGANVLLIANLLAVKRGEPPVLPTQGLLAEPMLAEGLRALGIAKAYSISEERAKNNPEKYISLQALRSEDAKALGMKAKHPLSDILDSKGIHLYTEALASGMDYQLVLSREDHAAPMETIKHQLEAFNLGDKVQTYPNQTRSGHGYMLAEQRAAAAYIGQYVKNFVVEASA